jgi:hypothetical protein
MDNHHRVGHSEQGSVVVDIGGEVGAAIVHAPASLSGSEIEIRRCGAVWDGTHVAVRSRHGPEGVVHAALFYGLSRGSYEARLRNDDEGPVATITVEGGRVSEAHLPCS